jgi:hypothetical protein
MAAGTDIPCSCQFKASLGLYLKKYKEKLKMG